MRLIKNNYYKPNITKEWVATNPLLRYSGLYSTVEENAYSYRFPVYKTKGNTLLECELVIFETSGNVTTNVYKNGTRDKYSGFYNDEFGQNEVLNIIEKNIHKEFTKLGIIQKKNKSIKYRKK